MVNVRYQLTLNRRDVHRFKTSISSKGRRIKTEIPDTIRDRTRRALAKGRRYINSRTRGFGYLATSLRMRRKTRKKSVSFSVYVNRSYLVNKTGRAYDEFVDMGYTPHIVSVYDKPNLREWVRKNLGKEALKRLIRANKMRVGYNTPWQPSGLKYSKYMMDYAAGRLPNEVQTKLNRIIRGR